jgi:hypothetical protein
MGEAKPRGDEPPLLLDALPVPVPPDTGWRPLGH